MPEHQQTQQSTESKTTFQKQATPQIQAPISHPMAIIQRARINPKSLTHADVMQLQRTIGNRAVVRLFSEIGLIPSTAKQAPPVQRQEMPEEEEPLQGKMAKTIQRQTIPEEEEPLQGKMIEPIQRQEIPKEDEPLQGKFENKPEQMTCPSCFAAPVVQRQELEDEEKPLQGKMIETIQRQEIPEEEEPLQTKTENNTGMPDNLKAGVESLSGIDMSDVRVHYNSSKPAEVGALAYTQGINIHVAPGQEKYLPHEAWHVVQQMQGRVQATTQMKGLGINDDPSLEHEADMMGAKTAQFVLEPYEEMLQRIDTHVGPGQEKHLPHETWHVVQQKNGELIQRWVTAEYRNGKLEPHIDNGRPRTNAGPDAEGNHTTPSIMLHHELANAINGLDYPRAWDSLVDTYTVYQNLPGWNGRLMTIWNTYDPLLQLLFASRPTNVASINQAMEYMLHIRSGLNLTAYRGRPLGYNREDIYADHLYTLERSIVSGRNPNPRRLVLIQVLDCLTRLFDQRVYQTKSAPIKADIRTQHAATAVSAYPETCTYFGINEADINANIVTLFG